MWHGRLIEGEFRGSRAAAAFPPGYSVNWISDTSAPGSVTLDSERER